MPANPRRQSTAAPLALALAATLLLAGTAAAATYTWTQNAASGTYDWSGSGNWLGGSVPPTGGGSAVSLEVLATAETIASGSTMVLNNNLAAGTPASFDLNSITLNGKISDNTLTKYTIQGGTLNFVADGATQPSINVPSQSSTGNNTSSAKTITNDITLANVTLSINANQNYYDPKLVISGAISGTGNIVRNSTTNGGGRYQPVELNGTKTFTGNLTVNGGGQTSLLTLGGSNQFTGNVTVNNNGRLSLNGTDAGWSGSTTVNSGGTLTFLIGNGYNWTNDIVNHGTLYLYGGSTDSSSPSTVSGAISGTGNVHLSGNSSYMRLTGANTYTGKTIISTHGWVSFDSIGNVDPDGTGPATALGRPNSAANGTIDVSWGQHVTYTGSGHSSDRNLNATTSGRDPWLRASGTGPLVLSGNFTVSANSNMTFQLDGTNTDENTFSGSILNRSGYSTSLTKSGTGLWVLGGNNTVADYYTGTTTVSGGALRGTLGAGGSIGSGNLSIAGSHQVDAVFESSADIVRPGGSGGGQMQIAASQAQAWSGFSARGGDINVAFGSLASPDALSWGTAPFNPGSSGKLILNASTADGTLDFKNPINLNGTNRTFRVDAATAILSGNLTNASGTAGLTKEGAGTLVLAGSNSYNGATTVSGGLLRLNTANAIPGGIGTSGGAANLSLAGGMLGLAHGDFARSLGTGAGQVQFTSHGGFAAFGADRTVNLGGGSATVTWNTGSFVPTARELILGAASATHTVNFQNPINLNGAVRTFQVGDGAAAVDAILSGSLSGTSSSGLSKTGDGWLRLTAANSYSGATLINGGTLEVAATGTLVNTSGITVANGASFIYNSLTALTRPLTVTNGTIGGTGAIITAVTIGTNAIVSPGSSPGSQTYAAMTWAPGGTYLWEINDANGTAGTDPGWDLLNIGTLTLNGLNAIDRFGIDIAGLAGVGPAPARGTALEWNIVNYDAPLASGFEASWFALNPTGFADPAWATVTWNIIDTGDQLRLQALQVPEPTSGLLLALAGLGLVKRRR